KSSVPWTRSVGLPKRKLLSTIYNKSIFVDSQGESERVGHYAQSAHVLRRDHSTLPPFSHVLDLFWQPGYNQRSMGIDLAALAKFDTPTICNTIELFEVRARTAGYMDA